MQIQSKQCLICYFECKIYEKIDYIAVNMSHMIVKHVSNLRIFQKVTMSSTEINRAANLMNECFNKRQNRLLRFHEAACSISRDEQ